MFVLSAVLLAALLPGQTAAPKQKALKQKLAPPSLGIGDPAPPVKTAKWIKGDPLTGFSPGQVYVVEFWATWCGPCLTSIPHLSELQKTYGDRVSFNGIAVWQREKPDAYVASVEKFVEKMGAQMAYNVGVDTSPNDGFMAGVWMTGAGQLGIPTAFVVDKDSKIAWIGHPLEPGLPGVLDKVLAGTYDTKNARADADEKARDEADYQEAMATVADMYRKGSDAAAEYTLKGLTMKHPEYKSVSVGLRFDRRIDKGQEKAAYDLLRAEWKDADMSASQLNELAWAILTEKRFKKPDTALATALAARAVAMTREREASIIDTLGYAHFKSGHRAQAITWAQKAVALTGGKDAELKARLAQYRRKG